MQALLKAKIGPFLVISSVLALWTLLATQHVQAHGRTESLPTPSCGTVPGNAFFGTAETHGITSVASTLTDTDLMTRRGGGTSGRGDVRYHYAKITIPVLAAGELRVFDATTRADDVLSDAVLCRGSSSIASSRTSYSVHNTAHTAADAADDNNDDTTSDDHTRAMNAASAADAAHTAADDDTTTPSLTTRLSRARSALSTARSALSAARSDLATAARALNSFAANASDPAAAGTAVDAVDDLDGVADDEQAALDALNNPNTALPPSSEVDATELESVKTALGNVRDALTAAVAALRAAAGHLRTAGDSEHIGFEIRASVSPGDQEYVVVVAPRNTGSPARANEDVRTLNLAFHGVIATTAATNIDGSLSAGDQHSYALTITAPGLLTVETTGNTDTMGMLDGPDGDDPGNEPDEVAMAESGGSGGNFKIVAPVVMAAHTLYVEGQTSQTTGDYTLDMNFKVAMRHRPAITGVTSTDGPDWMPVDIPDDGDPEMPELDSTSDEDYFLFSIAGNAQGFLTVESTDDSMTTAARNADTTGALYGPMGEIATDSNSGAGNHFRISAPVETGNYIVKVTGSTGGYLLNFALAVATDVAVRGTAGSATGMADCAGNANDSYEICEAATGMAQEVDQYTLPVTESGALYIHTVGSIDTVGILHGPDGSIIAEDDNSGADNNFRIAANVDPGLHLLQVRGKARSTAGVYELVTSFVAGDVATTPTTPGTGDEVADLQAEVAQLQRELDACEEPVETDSRGALGNPSGGGFRSGIGIISGWVCAASEVEVRISRGGVERLTLDVAYGTSRPDTVGQCDHSSPNTGFGMTYNFNHLPEGVHTIRAYADDELIGAEQTFEVVHLRPFAATDTNRFLRNLPDGECRVDDFPAAGEDTFLKWEQSTQNFVIEDAG